MSRSNEDAELPMLDLLLSLAGSALFWITVFGIAFREFRIDQRKLESFLEKSFKRADKFTFHIVPTMGIIVGSGLRAIYGSNRSRVLLVTFLSCVCINTLAIAKMHADWSDQKQQVERAVSEAINAVSPEYHRLAYSEVGRAELKKAVEQVGTQGGPMFVNDDPRSLYLRKMSDEFYQKYWDYLVAHKLTYDDNMELDFGEAHSNAYWIGAQGIQFGCGMFLTFIVGFAFDVAAVFLTLLAFDNLVINRYGSSLLLAGTVVLVFVFSFVNYTGLMHGQMAWGFDLVLAVLLGAVLVGAFLYYAIELLEHFTKTLRAKVLVITLTVLACIAVLILLSTYTSVLHPFFLFLREVGETLSDPNVVTTLASMPALYPMIGILSIFALVIVLKVIFVALKKIVLGQIYGASVLSGGTFFLGFVTVIISGTAVMWLFLLFLQSAILPHR